MHNSMSLYAVIMKKYIKIILVVLIAALGTMALFPRLVNTIAFHPSRSIAYRSTHPFIHERYIETDDDIKIHAYYISHDAGTSQLVIYFHGNAGNNSHRIYDALIFFKIGVDVLLVSYRGYGKSDGSPSEKGIYIDAESAYRYCINDLGYDCKNIFIYGRSIGSAAAIDLAQSKDVAGVIVTTPLLSGYDLAEVWGYGLFKYFISGMFDNKSKIQNVHAPVLIIHGTDDKVVPYSHGVKLYNTFTGKKKLVTIKQGRHNDLQERDPRAFWGSITKFIKNGTL